MFDQHHSGHTHSCRGGGGDSLIKVGTDVWALALGFSGVKFWPGIRFWEVKIARALGFWQFLRVKKVTYLLKNSNFGTLKLMKTCPVIRFLGTFLLGNWVILRILARPRLCTHLTPVPTFIRKSPPPPPLLPMVNVTFQINSCSFV